MPSRSARPHLATQRTCKLRSLVPRSRTLESTDSESFSSRREGKRSPNCDSTCSRVSTRTSSRITCSRSSTPDTLLCALPPVATGRAGGSESRAEGNHASGRRRAQPRAAPPAPPPRELAQHRPRRAPRAGPRTRFSSEKRSSKSEDSSSSSSSRSGLRVPGPSARKAARPAGWRAGSSAMCAASAWVASPLPGGCGVWRALSLPVVFTRL